MIGILEQKGSTQNLNIPEFPTDALIAYYSFDEEMNDNIIKDSSGNNLNAINNGGTLTEGKRLNSIYLDGSTKWVNANFLPPIGHAARSFVFWLKGYASRLNNHEHFFEYGENTNSKRFTLRRDYGSSFIRFEIQGFGVTANQTNIIDGYWHQIIYTHNGSTTLSGSKVFVDGNLEIDLSDSTAILDTGDSNLLAFGRDIALGLNRYAMLNMDEIAIYDRELTNEEIVLLWNNGNGNFMG